MGKIEIAVDSFVVRTVEKDEKAFDRTRKFELTRLVSSRRSGHNRFGLSQLKYDLSNYKRLKRKSTRITKLKD